VASGATWFAKRSGDKAADIDADSPEVSRSVAAIEASRRRAERAPRLTAELQGWGKAHVTPA
jgi:hypothetical protein